MANIRLGIDIGGTFTDITVLQEGTGAITIAKVASRRSDPAGALVDAVERGLALAKVDARDVTLLVHGSTLVTNAVLENNLPRTALLTTEGFRDVLEIGRHFRPDMYDLLQDKLSPVVPRERRFGVPERVTAEGEILRQPDNDAMGALLEAIRTSEAEAVAICFLNSFINPANEQLVQDKLRQGLPDLHTSTSYEVCREMREFERMSTVVLNAAAMPLVARYLQDVEPRIRKLLPKAKVLLMQSNGGSLTVAAAEKNPVGLITSGPAGGALAVQRIGRTSKQRNLLGVDMGGTSTDISLIHDGQLRMTTEGGIAQHPVKLPMIEINTIGAGAGSIAWLDATGGMHVGPRSAGAEPGPAAYGRGGSEPTVADANIVLGRLHPERFLGGQMKLDRNAAVSVLTEKIAKPLALTLEEAAAGIIRIANANMEHAVRVSSAEKGYDPRDITLVAFGGAGPLHAAALATAVGIPTVLVPEQPGVFSAFGLVMADIRHDFVRTRVIRDAEVRAEQLAPLYQELEAEALEALARDGVAEEHRRLQRSADLRYVGQAYEVNVPVAGGSFDARTVQAMLQRFHELHQQLYAHHHPQHPLEFVSARVAAIGTMAAPPMQKRARSEHRAQPKERRPVYFEETRAYADTAVYDRGVLTPGNEFAGPAIVEQIDTTTLIHPGQRVQVDDYGSLLIFVSGA